MPSFNRNVRWPSPVEYSDLSRKYASSVYYNPFTATSGFSEVKIFLHLMQSKLSGMDPVGTSLPRSRCEGAIRATLTRTPSASSLLRARRAVFPLLASHQGDPGSIPDRVTPDFRTRECLPDDAIGRWVSSGISRFPAPSFRCCSIITSITLIGSEYLVVDSRPNLSTTFILRHGGNTARYARRSDEALELRVTVARIARSLLDNVLRRAAPPRWNRGTARNTCESSGNITTPRLATAIGARTRHQEGDRAARPHSSTATQHATLPATPVDIANKRRLGESSAVLPTVSTVVFPYLARLDLLWKRVLCEPIVAVVTRVSSVNPFSL
ncbi:hypothetical protein PR048_023864 [Dryococelus australis]|uniref:Uncharacterized protein n=1 Tax=Dryococelus australis TaxID=614101 RepID=A0ABQ9GV78_9NEOP|nr:hypothetical protein PR048_023864 [Dryococelus australis]